MAEHVDGRELLCVDVHIECSNILLGFPSEFYLARE